MEYLKFGPLHLNLAQNENVNTVNRLKSIDHKMVLKVIGIITVE